MRNLRIPILCCLLAFSAFAFAAQPEFPPLTGRVVDQAGLLSPSVQQQLTRKLAAYQRANGTQVVVVTLKDLGGLPIDQYGYQLGRHWGIGQKGKDTGALLIVAPNQKKVRIEVGYGLEGRLTDALTFNIIDQIILPHFRQGDYQAGIVAGTNAVLQALGGKFKPRETHETRHRSFGGLLMLLMLGIGFLPMLFGRSPRGPGGFGRHRRGPGLGTGLLLGGLMGGMMGGRGGFGGGGFGGGGFGGGGFSGGGGSFGGGGASGSW